MKVETSTPMSGKSGAQVAYQGRSGQIIRVRVKPRQPRTAYQLLQRNRVADLSSSWRSLTALQRQAWITAAPNFPRPRKPSGTRVLTGAQLYVGMNLEQQLTGLPAILSPPDPQTFATNTVTGVTVAAGVITAQGTAPAVGCAVQCMASPPLSPGVSFPKGWKLIGSALSTTTFPWLLTALYTARFGTPPAIGTAVHFRFRQVQAGQSDNWIQYDVAVTA